MSLKVKCPKCGHEFEHKMSYTPIATDEAITFDLRRKEVKVQGEIKNDL